MASTSPEDALNQQKVWLNRKKIAFILKEEYRYIMILMVTKEHLHDETYKQLPAIFFRSVKYPEKSHRQTKFPQFVVKFWYMWLITAATSPHVASWSNRWSFLPELSYRWKYTRFPKDIHNDLVNCVLPGFFINKPLYDETPLSLLLEIFLFTPKSRDIAQLQLTQSTMGEGSMKL